MSTSDTARTIPDGGFSLSGLRFAVLTTRNFVFLIAILAMNFTLFRPSPVDLLFLAAFLISVFHLLLFHKREVTRRVLHYTLLILAWVFFAGLASFWNMGHPEVVFEMVSKLFAVTIGMTAGFVSMTWSRRNFETFMKVYIVSCVICAALGTVGFLTQNQLLTWDGRAKGLIDDPNMYGTFLIPAVLFCAYFMPRPGIGKLYYLGSMALILLGIFFSLSRIALVAALVCLAAYIFFQNRRNPRRLMLLVLGLVMSATLLLGIASVASPEFSERFLERLTLAQPYDLGEQGRYARYMLVLPMIIQDPIGVGVLALEQIFPEPIHNVWLSSFVNYGWGGGLAWVILAVGSVVVAILNYRQTRSDIPLVILASLIGVVMGATLHEGEHWRQMWLMFGMTWGFNAFAFNGGKWGSFAPQRVARAPGRIARPVAQRQAAPQPVTKLRVHDQMGPAR